MLTQKDKQFIDSKVEEEIKKNLLSKDFIMFIGQYYQMKQNQLIMNSFKEKLDVNS